MNKWINKISGYIISYSVFFLFLSCCTPVNHSPIVNQMAPMLSDDYCRIAILPFVNETSYSQGEVVLQKVFVAELIKGGDYLISQDGDVKKIFQQIKIYPGQSPNFEQLRIIADRLNVQLLITGRISEMSENSNGLGVNPVIAVTLQIFDAKTGTSLWITHHRREGEQFRKILHFGKINSITSLAQIISQEVIAKWYKEGFKKCIQ